MDVTPLLHLIRFYIIQMIMYASIDNISPAGVTCLSRYGVPPIFVKKYQYIQTFPRQRTQSNTKKKPNYQLSSFTSKKWSRRRAPADAIMRHNSDSPFDSPLDRSCDSMPPARIIRLDGLIC